MARLFLAIATGIILGTLSGVMVPHHQNALSNQTWDLVVFTKPLLDHPWLYSGALSAVICVFFLLPLRNHESIWLVLAAGIVSGLLLSNGFVLAGFFVFEEPLENWVIALKELHWQRLLLVHPVVCGTLCSVGMRRIIP